MASWETLFAFATLTMLVAYFPGPALLYTAAQTISHGRKAGLMAMLGIHLGCYLHVFAAAFGLSAVFKHVPELYMAVKLVGALYLVWLGIGMIRTKLAAQDAEMAVAPSKTVRRALLDSFIVEVLNPKVPVKLRLDGDVLEALRATGPGWQTRVNDMLKARISRGKVKFETPPVKRKRA